MSALRWGLSVLAVSVLWVGCGGAPTTPSLTNNVAMADQKPTAATPTAKPAAPAVLPRVPEPGPPLPPLQYDARGRRDPFAPVPVAKEKKASLDVAGTKLVGIIQGQQLLALLEAPDGLGYILKPGDVLGNGRVTDVTQRSVTFAVAGQADQRQTSMTLRLVSE